MSKTVLILNGPNLNRLGVREPEIYGHLTLNDIETQCRGKATSCGLEIDFRQSNSEGDLVGWAQSAGDEFDAIIINAGAYTHTSVALLDALLASSLPIVEVHLSNIFKREKFRHHSFVSETAIGVICGLGADGYLYAIDALSNHIGSQK